jgi:hypothetical protein
VPNIPVEGLARWLPRGWIRNAAFSLAGILVVTTGGVVSVWFASTLSVDQRIAAISAVLTGAALAVAVLAAILGVAAYLFTVRRPNFSIGLATADNDDGLQNISPTLTNYGDLTAASARVTFIFYHATILETQWQRVGDTMVIFDASNVHKTETIPFYLPSIYIHFDPADPDVSLSWTAVADRANSSGHYFLNFAARKAAESIDHG